MGDRRADLESFTASLRTMLDSDPDNEAFFEPGVARRVLKALQLFERDKLTTLDDAFGLKRGRGRPKPKPGTTKNFKVALQIHEMRSEGRSWTKIASCLCSKKGFDAKEVRDIYNRHTDAIIQHLASEVVRGVARRAKRRSLVARKRPRRL